MKYIVTNSLNIENILSTESISPASFYAQRRFGYKTFEQIKELTKFPPILLFSEMPFFEIADSEREAYPMVIEFDDEQQIECAKKVGSCKTCDVFAYGQTIRLTPNNCRLLFFTQKAMKLAMLKCRDSKLCKMSDYFKFAVATLGTVSLGAIVKKIEQTTIEKIEVASVNDDNSYDRARGLIYGYVIGATKSVSPTAAKMLSIQKRVYDILASVKNSQGQIGKAFRDELKELSAEYDNEHPDVQLAKDKWSKLLEECGEEAVLKFRTAIGLEESEAKRRFLQKQGLCIPQLSANCDGYALENYYSQISELTTSHIANDRKGSVDVCKDLDGGLHDHYRVMMENDRADDNLFNRILNRVVWENVIGDAENLRISRNNIATDVVKVVKDIIGDDKWTDSKERLYFHHLRENISEAKPFDLHEIDNVVYQSLAAFLLKGDDFDELVQYLENNAMPIYRYALALWGATVGYVRISRTITNALTQEQLEKLFKDAYSLLEGRDFAGCLCKADNNIAPGYDYVPSGELPTENCDGELFKQRMEDKFKATRLSLSKDDKSKLLSSLLDACNKVDEKDWNAYCKKVLNLLLEKDEWVKVKGRNRQPKAAYEKLKAQLDEGDRNVECCTPTQTKQQEFRFDANETGRCEPNKNILDGAWIEICKQYVYDGKPKFVDNARWFIDEHRPGGRYKNDMYSPNRIIEHFENYLNDKIRNGYFSGDVTKIIQYLKRNYADR